MSQIIPVFTCDPTQMSFTSPQNPSLKSPFTDHPQYLFLIYTVIQLRCKMQQLKKKIINIKTHYLAGYPSLSHFLIKSVNCFHNFCMIVLFNGIQENIKTFLTKHNPFCMNLHFLLIIINFLFFPESLKGSYHPRCTV